MAVILQFPVGVNSGLEFRIAHHEPMPNTEVMTFPNQRLIPAYIELDSYIRGNEFGNAKLIETPNEHPPYIVEVELRKSASNKLNKLAQSPKITGLGVFKNGEPVQLIQSVHGANPGSLCWYGLDTLESAKVILNLFSCEDNAP